MSKKKTSTQLIYCLLTAFLIMMICSRSSFLYPFNNWDDANGFFTMGKSIVHGLVPYRDLFEPKGILLYFLYALAYLISHTTFFGVFVIETLAACVVLFLAMRIIGLYAGDGMTYVLTPILGAVIYSSRCFWWGGVLRRAYFTVFDVGVVPPASSS